MLKVGITGGIGSGKSLISRMFSLLGVPVFNADKAAKQLMDHDPVVKRKLVEAFGEKIIESGRVHRPLLASLVFRDAQLLKVLNGIVHPATVKYAADWISQQKGDYILKEAALFFESGTYKDMDKMIGVSAPKELRIERVMERDGSTRTEVLERMANQMPEEEKLALCDFVIHNDETESVIQQVLHIHRQILSLTTK